MAYVDLNPIRSDMADSLETSDYTSIQERILPVFQSKHAIKNQQRCGDLFEFKEVCKPLLDFEGGIRNKLQSGLLYAFDDYLQLVDWTGRIIRDDKRGSIDQAIPPILARLQIDLEQWRINTTAFEAIHARRFNRQRPCLDTG
jgi:hypothetical protein